MNCNCLNHTKDEIQNLISENRYSSFEEFQNVTFIGTLCGNCLAEVDQLYREIHK